MYQIYILIIYYLYPCVPFYNKMTIGFAMQAIAFMQPKQLHRYFTHKTQFAIKVLLHATLNEHLPYELNTTSRKHIKSMCY
jgi:hypothetical protein